MWVIGLGVASCGRTWLRVPRAGAAIAAGLLGVPVGGGPPARRPRRELRSVRRLEARPGPAAAHGHRSLALRQPPHWRWWGFLHEAFWWRVADVSDPRVAKFFSFGGGEVAVSGSAVPKVQTTSVKNAENGLLLARWSAFWAQRRLVGCVVRARTRCCER